jgi:DNA-directed RNA polymerase specialized sigma24 family protein
VARLDSTAQTPALASALTTLQPNDRHVLLLAALKQLTLAEATLVLGIPPGTACIRLHRARGRDAAGDG